MSRKPRFWSWLVRYGVAVCIVLFGGRYAVSVEGRIRYYTFIVLEVYFWGGNLENFGVILELL